MKRMIGAAACTAGLWLCGAGAQSSAAPPPPKAAKGIAGDWRGTLQAGPTSLAIVFHFKAAGSGWSGTLDSPDQGAFGLACSEVQFAGGKLTVKVPSVGGSYTAEQKPDGSLAGQWSQGGASLPLVVKRGGAAAAAPKRPQTPKPPFPYTAREVAIENPQGKCRLAGTLTVPNGAGPFPAVVLVTGSGPQDRDEALMGHKPFLVLADHLSRHGIAVLRCDDRGVGKSTGNFATATTADFATDAEAAVEFLKSQKGIKANRIGILGHSEGGLIAPLVASRNKDVAFVVMLAGPGVPGDQILFEQSQLILKASGADNATMLKQKETQTKIFAILKGPGSAAEKERKIKESLHASAPGATGVQSQAIDVQAKSSTSPWFMHFITYDPRPTLRKVKCPVLALWGAADLQVPPAQSQDEVERALKAGGNRDVTTRVLPGLNHLFQTAKTGSPAEYAKIEETMSPKALNAISDWVIQHGR